jgi:hypothetical protein
MRQSLKGEEDPLPIPPSRGGNKREGEKRKKNEEGGMRNETCGTENYPSKATTRQSREKLLEQRSVLWYPVCSII